MLFVAGHLSFAGIREDRDSGLTQLNKLRLGAKVYRVLPLSPGKYIQITLQLSSVISRDQDYADPDVPVLKEAKAEYAKLK
jgi:hypothetical protein